MRVRTPARTSRFAAVAAAAAALLAVALPGTADAAPARPPVLVLKAGQALPGAAATVHAAFPNCTVGTPNANIALTPGFTMTTGQTFCPGNYELALQGDGNLVVYGPTGALWWSGTAIGSSTSAPMQTDGNFVVYSGTTPLWNAGTWGHPGAYVCIQLDGNLVVYAPNGGNYTCSGPYLWASRT
ncbi:hypothetical protein ACFW1A_39135 [Kitasatospora sp. NPDC058965]|uniref:hypothetical protein n=1 Tax=Kitasatospora sp. NPDC058965 TaxID=3346682 RepID=UPI0036BF17B9